jgi:tight adherence protein B
MSFPFLVAETDATITFIIFPLAGSMLLAYGIYQVVVDSRKGERRRLADRLRGRSTVQQRGGQPAKSILRRAALEDAGGMFSQLAGRLSFTPKLQTLLDQANVNISASKMLVNQSVIAFLAFFGLLALDYSPLAAIAASAGVIFLPLVFLKTKRAHRMKKLTAQLPDVFEIMSQALRAGHSLASALEVVQEQLPDPVGPEFGRVYHEQNLGIKIEDALLSMADRVDSLDVRFFVTAVLVQRQTGGDLAEVLDKIGSVIRDRIELFGMVQGLTAEGRLSGWVLFALPMVVFAAVNLLNPSYAEVLFTEPIGKILLLVAGGMQLMGLAMIRWIVNIKV